MNADANTTVAELAALADRTAKALAEAGEGELGEKAHVVVTRDGCVRLSFCHHPDASPSHEAVDKALSFDPVFDRLDRTLEAS